MQFQAVGPITLGFDAVLPPGRRVIVFINSLGTDFRIWDDVAADLGRDWGILRYDKRGHGLSGLVAGVQSIADHAGDLAQLLDGQGVRGAVLCGLSVGGMIALALADHRPDLVAGLVLCDTAPRIGTAESWNARIAAVRNAGMAAIADGVMERWFSPAFHATRGAELSGYRAMLTRTPAEGYAATCAAIRDADLTAAAGRIAVPCLCIAGDGDRATPPDLVRAMAETIPGATFETVAGAGHLPCVEQPGALCALIRDVMARIEFPAAHDDLYAMGMRTRRAVLGDSHVDRAEAAATAFDAPFQRLIAQSAWGSVWSRPGLTRRERSLITIALLATLGHDDEVTMHVRASRNTGASAADISEALLHVAIYAGVPAANRAFHTAKKALKDMEDLP